MCRTSRTAPPALVNNTFTAAPLLSSAERLPPQTSWGMSLNKMQTFNWTHYRKIVFMDSDTLAFQARATRAAAAETGRRQGASG